jgi:hypothetical protein
LIDYLAQVALNEMVWWDRPADIEQLCSEQLHRSSPQSINP